MSIDKHSAGKGGEIKITGGELGGRKIKTPGGTTHPMGERERIALFNMIITMLPGATAMDAFAGSGALGIEMLSRGAQKVVFVEKNTSAAKVIRQNLERLNIPDAVVRSVELSKTIMDGLAADGIVVQSAVRDLETETKFDIILADPPYDDFKTAEVARLANFLKEGGVLALSHPEVAPLLPDMKLKKSRSYAGANISIYQKVVK